MTDKNVVQEVADDLLTDPDKDAAVAPAPPQTIDAEPALDSPRNPQGDR